MTTIMAAIWSIAAIGFWLTDQKTEALLCLILTQGERHCAQIEKWEKKANKK